MPGRTGRGFRPVTLPCEPCKQINRAHLKNKERQVG